MKSPRILITEDEVLVAVDLANQLRDLGYDIVGEATSGEDAVGMAEETHPDLVLMDIRLKGGMDGIEAARRIRSSLDSAIVYLTAHDEPELFERAKLTEPFGYLSKPVSERELARTVEMALHKRSIEMRLRESDEFNRRLVEYSPMGIIYLNGDGIIEYTNPASNRMFEVPEGLESPFRGVGIFDLPLVAEQRHVKEAFHRLMAGEPQSNIELDYRSPITGRDFVLLASVAPRFSADGTVSGAVAMFMDITELRHAEQALSEREERLRLAWETSPDAFSISRLDDGKYVDINNGYTALTGYEREEVIGGTALDLPFWHDPADREPLLSALKRDGHARNLEARIRHKSGKLKTVLISAALMTLHGEPHLIALTKDIEQLKEAEEALRRSENLYRTLAEHTSVGIWQVDDEGRAIFINPVMCEMLEIDGPEELLGRTYRSFFDRENLEIIDRENAKRSKGKSSVYEIEITGKRGTRRTVAVSGAPHFSADGSLEGTIGTFMDMTETRRTQEALRQSEERYRSLILNAPIGIISVDKGGRITEINPHLLDILGSPSVEATKSINLLTYQPLVDAGVSDAFKRCLQEGRKVELDTSYVSMWGKSSYLRAVLTPRTDAQGNITGCQATVEDITDRKKAEEALKGNERFLSDIFSGIQDGISVLDKDLNIVRVNPVMERRHSHAMPLVGKKCHEVYRRRSSPCEPCPSMRAMETAETAHEIVERRQPDGEVTWSDVFAFPLFDSETGRINGVIEYVRDITERRRAEEERLRLATAIEQAAEAVVVADTAGRIQYVNPSFEKVTGYSKEEVVGENPRILKSGEHDAEFYEEMWRILTSGEVWTGRLVNKKKDGTLYEEEAAISPIKDESGKIVNYVAVKRDVTGEMLLERQLRQAQKLEAVGTLAGGVAHDFNNLLQVILGYADMLLLQKDRKDPDREKLLAMRKAAGHGGDLVKKLLTFSRKGEISLRPTDLNQEAMRVRELLYRTIPKMIEIELFLAKDLKTVEADPGQMEQVLLNLAINARDAMPDGGRLTIETKNITLDEGYCNTHIEVGPGEYVLMTVSDTGHGMVKDVVERIFEPFFTTKESGQGTGLGLATVFGIIKSHHGHIMCYSEPGEGTTFKIYLPAIVTEVAQDMEMTTEMLAFGTETILLVDDEDQIRDMGREMLTIAGYKVLTARNGREALELFRKRGPDISLVILDLIMPEIGGRQCLVELLRMDPGIRILVASGYSANGPTKESLEAGAKGFISKPFEASELVRTVRKVLDAD
jgi:PAS domain S-box-containing protein